MAGMFSLRRSAGRDGIGRIFVGILRADFLQEPPAARPSSRPSSPPFSLNDVWYFVLLASQDSHLLFSALVAFS
jgi:hypothetical protein